ncbi:MAG: histidine-type phosphatase [Sphingomonadaceae bacterium]|nr:histidine-type phosphatase [Sphingomonadaceae bacterium]
MATPFGQGSSWRWASVRARKLLAAAAAGLLAAAAPPPGPPPGESVERVFILMRHGVRTPTKNPPMPAGVTPDAWPTWPVPPGHLTPSGGKNVALIGAYDRAALVRWGVLPGHGCPASGQMDLRSDSDQRTIASADLWAAAALPGCRVDNRHRPEGSDDDPLFATAGASSRAWDAAKANAAFAAALGSGGVAALEARMQPALTTIDRIFCGNAQGACGVKREPSRIEPATQSKRPKIAGALDRGSSAAQILLLEYADGKPMAEVGWGRASASDVSAVSVLHASEYGAAIRAPYLAAHHSLPIARLMLAAFDPATRGPRLTVVMGHDTNLAALGGLLGLHWQAGGLAADDPAPGGAIVLTLVRLATGERMVRALYRSQSLEEMRAIASPGAIGGGASPMPVAACGASARREGCPLAAFQAAVRSAFTNAGIAKDEVRRAR